MISISSMCVIIIGLPPKEKKYSLIMFYNRRTVADVFVGRTSNLAYSSIQAQLKVSKQFLYLNYL